METCQNVSASFDCVTSNESKSKLLFWKKKKGSIFDIGRKKGTYDISNNRTVKQVLTIEYKLSLASQLNYMILFRQKLHLFGFTITLYVHMIVNR
jgi:hypothetical protein